MTRWAEQNQRPVVYFGPESKELSWGDPFVHQSNDAGYQYRNKNNKEITVVNSFSASVVSEPIVAAKPKSSSSSIFEGVTKPYRNNTKNIKETILNQKE